MDVEKNHRLDWFFNDYVYGTEIPSYSITSQVEKKGDDTIIQFKLAQSGVSDKFVMLVPLYLELEDGRIVVVGKAAMRGTTQLEQSLNFGKLQSPAKRMVVNYYYDVLSTN